MDDEILKIKNLKKNYQNKQEEIKAIENFSFDFEENAFVAIVGPSGCGKTTILSILAGILKKSSGTINLKKNKKIGYMLQQDALFEWRTILDNCLISLEIDNNLNEENREYVINLLTKYGLKEFMNSYPSNLSGGMRQRVA